MSSPHHKRTIAIGFLVSAVALGYFLSGIHLSELQKELSSIRLPWVVLAISILVFEFWLRAWRWQLILRPAQIDIPISRLFTAQVIGATCNTLLPLRAGEFAKPLVAKRHTQAPFLKIIATTIMERVYDIMGMVFILVMMLLLAHPDTSNSANAALVYNLQFYGGCFGLFAALCMVIFFVLASGKTSTRNIFEKLVSLAPKPVANKLLEFFDVFVEGLASSTNRDSFWKAGVLSLWMWCNGSLAIYALFMAFDMNLPFGAACFVSVAIALTVALPQAPGFAGVFHVAMEKTMLLWGQTEGPAEGFAIVFWAVSFVPVTAIGLLSLWREGLSLHSVSSQDSLLDISNTSSTHRESPPKE